MSRTRIARGLAALLILLITTLSAAAVAQNVRGGGKSLEDAFTHGRYAEARRLAMQYDDAASLLMRGKLAARVGDRAEAQRFAKATLAKASERADKDAAELLLAELERDEGKWTEAEARLRRVLTTNPNAFRVRFMLGELLRRQGKIKQSDLVLDQLIKAYNNGVTHTPDMLVNLARAQILQQHFQDANTLLEEVEASESKHIDALIVSGELFLQKYNIQRAREFFDRALKINPKHVRALVGRALAEMAASNQTDRVRELLDRAAKEAPRDPDMLAARALLAMRDEDCTTALKHAREALKNTPKHLDSLSVITACHYLKDDDKAYREALAKTLALNPKYADVYVFVGDSAVRAHRYVQAMALYREALKLVPDHSGALLGLGIGLTRVGKEDEALEFLGRAFREDQYNVRAFNMLNLYEGTLNKSYSFTDFDGFKLRTHKDQRKLLELVVAPVVAASIKVFNKKYGITPDPYLAVEVYPNPQTFGVRSVGLPHISPHGICFGRVVTVRSPSDGNFNWRQVVWHEMAHVYHLKLSNSRVPRWFAEGLAEYETNVHDPAWSRYHDQEIAIKLFKDEIPSVVLLNRGFTHARTQGEVLRSYHLASLAIHYIAETYGFAVIPQMLKSFAAGEDTAGSIQKVLKVTVASFDAGFAKWLRHKYMHFAQQSLVDAEEFGSRAALERAITMNASNARAHARLAVIYMAQGNVSAMESALKRALEVSPKDWEVNMIAAEIRMRQGRAREVLAHGEAVLDKGKESYDMRVLLGRAAMLTEDMTSARVHFEAAVQLYPDGVQAWLWMERLALAIKDDALKQVTQRRIYELNQHSPALARGQYLAAIERKNWKDAERAARRWLDTNPFDPRAHRAWVDVNMALKRPDEAVIGWRGLLALQPKERQQLYERAIKQLADAGYAAQAEALKKEAGEQPSTAKTSAP